MLGCIQPMSSPMMNMMLGFCAGACASAGLTKPGAAPSNSPPATTAVANAALAVDINNSRVFIILSPEKLCQCSRITQRKPMWLMPLSIIWACRAAGR